MEKIISKLRRSRWLGKIIHTLDHCLQRELEDCESVLDLGCGPSSPLQYCGNVKYSVGVETFQPYLEESRRKNIHIEYLKKRIEEVDFPRDSFDAVIMIEVLEHLTREAGFEILEKAEKWAKKKIIISTPNGYFPMGAVDNNMFQRHLSGWSIDALEKLGFKCYGVSGLKFLYLKENAVRSLNNEKDSTFSNIKFKPKKFFYIVNGILQVFSYHFPKTAFGLFAVKNKNA